MLDAWRLSVYGRLAKLGIWVTTQTSRKVASIVLLLLLHLEMGGFVMSRHDLAAGGAFKLLQALRASKPDHAVSSRDIRAISPGFLSPGRMVSSKPALRNAVSPLRTQSQQTDFFSSENETYVLNDVAVIAHKEESARLLHIDLHADQS